MANHISQQTNKRAYKGFVSFFESIKKGIHTARLPNYLEKNGRYNVFFTKNNFKKEIHNNKCCIRLTGITFGDLATLGSLRSLLLYFTKI